jgi:predicted HTH domain antitoxin
LKITHAFLVNERIGKAQPLFFIEQGRMSRRISERERTVRVHSYDAELDSLAKRSRFLGLQIPLSAQNGLDYVTSH